MKPENSSIEDKGASNAAPKAASGKNAEAVPAAASKADPHWHPPKFFDAYSLDIKEAFKHLLFGCIVGAVTGLASVLLCICVDFAFGIFRQHQWLAWLLPIMGILQLLLYRAFKLPPDLLTHQVVNRIRNDECVSKLLAPGILIATTLAAFCGASVGKEAGALQIGSSLGSTISRFFSLKSVYKKEADKAMDGYAAATGMAACFSALFFAPLGACMFVLELSRFNLPEVRHVLSMLLACFIAFLISSHIGIGDSIDKVILPAFDWKIVGQCALVGLAAAFVGAVFDNAIQWIHDITWRITQNLYVWVVIGGLAFAALVTFCGWAPFATSGGDSLHLALHGDFEPWGFAIKALLTCICLGFWIKGGEIMPSFCIGGMLGASCTYLTGGSPELGAAVGVMSFFAAFSRCPLASFLMGCEIFGWDAAGFLAIGILVAMVCGSTVGYYGEGVDKVLRMRWGIFSKRFRSRAQDLPIKPLDAAHDDDDAKDKDDKDYVGFLHDAVAITEALSDTIKDDKSETSKPD